MCASKYEPSGFVCWKMPLSKCRICPSSHYEFSCELSKYTYLPYKIYISKILDKKETSFSSQDFLKEYVFSNQEENLEMIADKKPEFYQVFVNFLDTVNNTIYKNKKSISEKPEVEPEIIDFEQLMAEELDFDSLMEEQLG